MNETKELIIKKSNQFRDLAKYLARQNHILLSQNANLKKEITRLKKEVENQLFIRELQ